MENGEDKITNPDHASRMVSEIDVKSSNTAIAQRDKYLLSPNFFAAESHPEIVFTSNTIVTAGENSFTCMEFSRIKPRIMA